MRFIYGQVLCKIFMRNDCIETQRFYVNYFRIRSDNNVDNSIEILNEWISSRGEMYHSLNVYLNTSSTGFEDESSIADWSLRRFAHVIDLREQALDYARKIWADFILVS